MTKEHEFGKVTFAVMITSRNRREDLALTLNRLRALSPLPMQIFVYADGCEDGTESMVQENFPEVILLVHPTGQGSIPSRNQMLRQSTADWVLSLDDDSYPLADDFFAQAVKLIDSRPDVSVFTFPEQRDGETYASPTKTPRTPGHAVSAYPNCAALMSRKDYLSTGGYPLFFIHAYEEPDYALQVYAKGKMVWFEPSLIVRHHLSAKNRSSLRTHHFNARNELWSVWMRCPLPWLPLISLFRIARQFQYACSQGFSWVLREPLWWIKAIQGLAQCVRIRQPLPWKVYFHWMKLARLKID